jgi:hypothetical protein
MTERRFVSAIVSARRSFTQLEQGKELLQFGVRLTVLQLTFPSNSHPKSRGALAASLTVLLSIRIDRPATDVAGPDRDCVPEVYWIA